MKRIFTSTNICHFLTPQFKTIFDGNLCSESGLFCNMRPFSAVCRFPACMQTLLLTGGIQAQVGGGGDWWVNLATIQRLPPPPQSHTQPLSSEYTHLCLNLGLSRLPVWTPGTPEMFCCLIQQNLRFSLQHTKHTCTCVHIHKYTVPSCKWAHSDHTWRLDSVSCTKVAQTLGHWQNGRDKTCHI